MGYTGTMAFADPEHNIEQFMLGDGAFVADLGAGSGAYSFAASRAVGGEGRVFAVEIQRELLDRLKNAASRQGHHNIEVIWGDLGRLGGTKLRDFSLDAVIASNVLFQVEDKKTLAQEIRRILKPKGKVLVIDWTDSFGNLGPSPENVFKEGEAKALFSEHGFAIEKDIQAGDHHYGFVARNTLG